MRKSSSTPCKRTDCAVSQFVLVNTNDSPPVKSAALSGPSSSTGPDTDNATVTSADGRVANFTEYDASPLFSETVRDVCDNTNPAVSSSVIPTVSPWNATPESTPITDNTSADSTSSSSTGVNVKVVEPDTAPAAIKNVLSGTIK